MRRAPTRRNVISTLASLPAGVAHARNVEYRLSRFGGVADGSIDGRGTDNGPALRALLKAAATSGGGRLIIEPGIYCFDGTLACVSPAIADLVIEGWGAALIGRKSVAEPGDHFFHIRHPADDGGALTIAGLELAMARPSVRTSNVDMLLVEGFRSTLLDGLKIPCADNMGVSFDRRSSRFWVPEEIIGRNLDIGGRKFEKPHSHGSIGDSGIWIPRGAKWIDINARIQSTGDDACYLGPIPERHGEPVVRAAFRLNLATYKTVGAFHVEMPNGVLTGTADTTLTAAVACNPALDGAPSARIDNIRVNVDIRNAGMLAPKDIGAFNIPQVNNCGVWLYGAGRNIDLTGTQMKNINGPAILLQAKSGQILEAIAGRLTVDRILVNASGRPKGGDGAVIKRSATGAGVVRQVNLSLTVRNSDCPIVSWLQTGPNDDSDITVQANLANSQLDRQTYAGKELANFYAAGPGAPKRVRLNFGGVPGMQRLQLGGKAHRDNFVVR
jgi:hypothetical protein